MPNAKDSTKKLRGTATEFRSSLTTKCFRAWCKQWSPFGGPQTSIVQRRLQHKISEVANPSILGSASLTLFQRLIASHTGECVDPRIPLTRKCPPRNRRSENQLAAPALCSTLTPRVPCYASLQQESHVGKGRGDEILKVYGDARFQAFTTVGTYSPIADVNRFLMSPLRSVHHSERGIGAAFISKRKTSNRTTTINKTSTSPRYLQSETPQHHTSTASPIQFPG